VTVLFFEEARKKCEFLKKCEFFGDRGFPLAFEKMRVFWGQGVPPCSPRGRVDSKGAGSILPGCYENKALNTVVFFIYEIVKQFTEPRGFKEKAT
jgi:hypothetical protein